MEGQRVRETLLTRAREMAPQAADLVLLQIGLDARVFGQRDAGHPARATLEHRERGDDEEVRTSGLFDPIRVRRLIEEEMRQPARPRRQRLPRRLLGRDMHHRKAIPLPGRRDHGGGGLRREGWNVSTVERAVLAHELDEVRALREPRLDPRIGLLRSLERGDREAELGAVAARRRGQRAGRQQIRAGGDPSLGLGSAQAGRHPMVREHVDLGGHAELERPREGRSEGVHVAVDQSGDQGPALPGHGPCPLRSLEPFAHRGNGAPLHQHVRLLEHLLAVEDPHASIQGRIGLRHERRRHPSKDHHHRADPSSILFDCKSHRYSPSALAAAGTASATWINRRSSLRRGDTRAKQGPGIRR